MASNEARSSEILSKQSSDASQDSNHWEGDRESGTTSQIQNTSTADIPKPKRIACVVCRKRKLRCDGIKPSCGTCSRLGHGCAYDEIRRKSGPKRGYVKALEARLAQVEILLKDQSGAPSPDWAPQLARFPFPSHRADPLLVGGDATMNGMDTMLGGMQRHGSSPSPNLLSLNSFHGSPMMNVPPPLSAQLPQAPASHYTMVWDMIAMGLEEALPDQDVIDALHKIYFEKIHPCMPIIHKPRYLASMSMAPSLRPPVSLRYAMWTLAASVSDGHVNLQTHLYRRARKYLEDSEMKGHGEGIISVASAQAWLLITTYEFKLMYFPRAWMSTGRAVRLSQMMGLHRLDGTALEVKQCLPAPRDWIEREERRRTFWMAFCLDRYASIGTGWPLSIEEKDILTNLPSTESAYENGRRAKGMTLKEAMTAEGAALVSPFGGVCLMASLFGSNLIHLHRPDPDERDDDLSGEFWRRHRHMDHVLLNIQLSLPAHFRLPAGIEDPNVVFTNMNIATSTICLHQAAIYKAEKHRMPSPVSAESKIRCITAAAQIASIMRMVCHLDLSGMNPFIAFCLYVAARVFVQYLKSRPGDEQVRASLQFLLTAMGHMKRKNPLTESFLVQLDVDLTGSLECPGKVNKFSFRRGADEAPLEKTVNANYPTPHPVTEIPVDDLPYITIPTCMQGQRDRAQNDGSAEKLATDSFLPALSPHSNVHSPASLDTSEHSHSAATPSSQDNLSGANSSYSPPPNYFSEFSGLPMSMDSMDSYGSMSKDIMNWDMLSGFEGDVNLEHDMSGMGGLNGMGIVNPDLGDIFVDRTA